MNKRAINEIDNNDLLVFFIVVDLKCPEIENSLKQM